MDCLQVIIYQYSECFVCLIMSNYNQTSYQICQDYQNITNSPISNHQMTNLRTDEMVFVPNLTKIGTDENKAIYSNIILKTSLVSIWIL